MKGIKKHEPRRRHPKLWKIFVANAFVVGRLRRTRCVLCLHSTSHTTNESAAVAAVVVGFLFKLHTHCKYAKPRQTDKMRKMFASLQCVLRRENSGFDATTAKKNQRHLYPLLNHPPEYCRIKPMSECFRRCRRWLNRSDCGRPASTCKISSEKYSAFALRHHVRKCSNAKNYKD